MLNQTTVMHMGNNSHIVSFNTPCTGILQRSNPNSIFIRFQQDSIMEKCIFPSNGSVPYAAKFEYGSPGYDKYKSSDGKVEVTVLQILLFGDNQYLVEVIELKYLVESKL